MEIVVRCPSCLDPNRHSEIASIGGWYLTFWTDGWRHPVPPSGSIFRCGSCGYVSFRDEFSDLGPLVRPMRLGDVELVDVGPNRVRVMATLRAAVGLDLSAVRRLVEEMPVIVATDLYFADAKALANALHDNGAACVLHAKELGTSSPASWFDAPQLATARDIATLNRLADLSSRSSVLERHLRMELYWAANHPFRERNYPWIPVSRRCPAERENAKRLFSLLREDDTASRLAKANIARESADFATANHLLATEVFGDLAPMAARLSQLTDSEESALLPLSQDGPDAAQQGNGD
jgi:hypothetical protein